MSTPQKPPSSAPFAEDPIVRIFLGPDPADEQNVLLGYQRNSGERFAAPVSRRLLAALVGSWQLLEVLPPAPGAVAFEARHVDLQKPVTYAVLG